MERKQYRFLLCAAAFLLLSACRIRSSEESLITGRLADIDEETVIYGTTGWPDSKSYSEHGVFFQTGATLQFYDIEAGETFVLCARSNCRHADSSCSAWYGEIGEAVGLALYGKKVYVIKRNERSNAFELTSMDPSGSGQKVVYSMDIGDFSAGTWYLESINSVYYTGGTAWFQAYYTYVESVGGKLKSGVTCDTVTGVNLEDGTARVIRGLPDKSDFKNPEALADCGFELVSNSYIVLKKSWNASVKLSQSEFLEALAGGEYQEFSTSPDPYYSYTAWHEDNGDYRYEYLVHDTRNAGAEVFESGQAVVTRMDDGRIQGIFSPYFFCGEYDSKLLFATQPRYFRLPENAESVYLYDPQSGGREPILELENGGLLATSDVSHPAANGVTGGEELLYCSFTGGERADVFAYNLRTKEHVKLFEDHERITFRIVWESADRFYGMLQNFTTETEALRSISKEEYRRGNLNAAERLY